MSTYYDEQKLKDAQSFFNVTGMIEIQHADNSLLKVVWFRLHEFHETS